MGHWRCVSAIYWIWAWLPLTCVPIVHLEFAKGKCCSQGKRSRWTVVCVCRKISTNQACFKSDCFETRALMGTFFGKEIHRVDFTKWSGSNYRKIAIIFSGLFWCLLRTPVTEFSRNLISFSPSSNIFPHCCLALRYVDLSSTGIKRCDPIQLVRLHNSNNTSINNTYNNNDITMGVQTQTGTGTWNCVASR